MSDQKTGRKYTPAHLKATKKYIAEHKDRFTAMMDKGVLDEWKAAAAAAGVSTNKYVIEAVDRQITRDIMNGVIPNVKDYTTRADAGEARAADQSHDQEQ